MKRKAKLVEVSKTSLDILLLNTIQTTEITPISSLEQIVSKVAVGWVSCE